MPDDAVLTVAQANARDRLLGEQRADDMPRLLLCLKVALDTRRTLQAQGLGASNDYAILGVALAAYFDMDAADLVATVESINGR